MRRSGLLRSIPEDARSFAADHWLCEEHPARVDGDCAGTSIGSGPAASTGITTGVRDVRAFRAVSVGSGAVPVRRSEWTTGGDHEQDDRPRKSEGEGADQTDYVGRLVRLAPIRFSRVVPDIQDAAYRGRFLEPLER